MPRSFHISESKSSSPPERLMDTAADLWKFAADDKRDIFVRPKSVQMARHNAIVFDPNYWTVAQPAQRPPSSHLRAYTNAAVYHLFPEASHSPNSFTASTSRLDLPLQASTTNGSSARLSGRLGDSVNTTRTEESLASSLRTSSIPSLQAIKDYNRRIEARRGRAKMVAGGAPMHPEVAWSLRMLQVAELTAPSTRLPGKPRTLMQSSTSSTSMSRSRSDGHLLPKIVVLSPAPDEKSVALHVQWTPGQQQGSPHDRSSHKQRPVWKMSDYNFT